MKVVYLSFFNFGALNNFYRSIFPSFLAKLNIAISEKLKIFKNNILYYHILILILISISILFYFIFKFIKFNILYQFFFILSINNSIEYD